MSKLIFEYSSMNAGKSTKLLQTAHNYESIGNSVMLLKPSLDKRTANTIYSRLGLEKECFLIDNNELIIDKYKDMIDEKNIDVILVDEAQFLNAKQVYELRELTVTHNITVICYGLRTTFEGIPFEGSSILLGISDKLVENITLCVECSKKATMTLKINEYGEVIKKDKTVIDSGEENKYKSVCFQHWFMGMNF